MKKLIIPILATSVIISGIGGYFIGKSVAQREIQAKEEVYRKSADAAKEVATKYLNALKFGDRSEAYGYTCPEFKSEVTEAKFVSRWEKIEEDLISDGTTIQDFPVTDVIVTGDTAKIRFTQVYHNPVTKEFSKPSQAEFKLVAGQWCTAPSTEGY